MGKTVGRLHPYELRTVERFVRLGWCMRTQELLAFFIADQPPPGGLVFVWSGEQPDDPTCVNDQRVRWQGAELRIRQLPTEVSIGNERIESLKSTGVQAPNQCALWSAPASPAGRHAS